MGIFQTAVGAASWDSHPGMVLMLPPPSLLTYGWTEVSLSPCADHRAPIAASVSGAALYRSVYIWLLM